MKAEEVLREFQAAEEALQDPSVVGDAFRLKEVSQKYAELRTAAEKIRELRRAEEALKEDEAIVSGGTAEPELIEMAREEAEELTAQVAALQSEVADLLREPDPFANKNVIVEIRAGVGGDEAGLFAAELYRMYTMFASARGWKVDLISMNRTGIGGVKEVVFEIKGRGVYGDLQFESGVHRVQRVPETEKAGRVHTSAVTVAIMPEPEAVDIVLDLKDLKIETTTSQGAGGQSVNTTYSAIRMVHLPTGIVVTCQDERSQQQNKERAMQIMRARVFEAEVARVAAERAAKRKSQIGTGDRSEKIRTYNFPQDRVTDHRIEESWHNLPKVMDGNIGEIIAALKKADEAEG
ncbi:MAG: peptide chain release factor 1 [Candidatus Magasanikbacteria bacterium]|nr:peptide chain release factor 1 [Candidatus Magasanikbacteria bacterium]